MVEFMCCTGQRYTNSAADKTGHPVDLANYVRESDSRCEQEQKKGLIACWVAPLSLEVTGLDA